MINNDDDEKKIVILLVEDTESDARLVQLALREAKVRNKVFVACDGVEAMAFLRKEDEYKNMPRPDVILLDLNMPMKDGRETLKEIKADNDLKRIPVVILTVSKAEEDILKSYNLHANCYITKPVTFDEFLRAIKLLEDFWLTVVKLPPK